MSSADKTIVRTIAVISAFVLCIFFLAIHDRHPNEANWRVVEGTTQGMRVVADHVVETKWGSQLTWRADYKVVYSVANREYNVWADSGIRAATEPEVRMLVPQAPLPCRVQYDPERPNVSKADCR